MLTADTMPTSLYCAPSPPRCGERVAPSTYVLLAIARPAGRGARSLDRRAAAGPHLTFISVALRPEQEFRVVVSRRLLPQFTPHLRCSCARTVARAS
jgi:hypothetical protein